MTKALAFTDKLVTGFANLPLRTRVTAIAAAAATGYALAMLFSISVAGDLMTFGHAYGLTDTQAGQLDTMARLAHGFIVGGGVLVIFFTLDLARRRAIVRTARGIR